MQVTAKGEVRSNSEFLAHHVSLGDPAQLAIWGNIVDSECIVLVDYYTIAIWIEDYMLLQVVGPAHMVFFAK